MILEKIYQALKAESALTNLLASGAAGIYNGMSKDAGTYPVLIFTLLSDVPALAADGQPLERRVTIRTHIKTRGGGYRKIDRAAGKVMQRLGGVRVQSQNIAVDSTLRMYVSTYEFGIGEDE